MKCTHNIPKQRLASRLHDLCRVFNGRKTRLYRYYQPQNGQLYTSYESRDEADQAIKLTKRAGFGTLRAITKGSSQRKTKYQYDGCSTSQVGSQELYEHVGKTYIDYLDVDKDIAERYLTRSLDNFEISQLQYNKIKQLCYKLNTITNG